MTEQQPEMPANPFGPEPRMLQCFAAVEIGGKLRWFAMGAVDDLAARVRFGEFLEYTFGSEARAGMRAFKVPGGRVDGYSDIAEIWGPGDGHYPWENPDR
jgi:hypothetical protein